MITKVIFRRCMIEKYKPIKYKQESVPLALDTLFLYYSPLKKGVYMIKQAYRLEAEHYMNTGCLIYLILY